MYEDLGSGLVQNQVSIEDNFCCSSGKFEFGQ